MNTKTWKILLVEDNKIAQRIPMLLLANMDAKVDLAETGEQALELLRTTQYDLILMDIGLPDMSGIDALKSMREAAPNNRNAYIVVLTAHADEEVIQEADKAFFNKFVAKPLTQESLSDILSKL